ncbi:MAG TPA: helix-turn-helix domain-containing protein [Micromonosporaceae bacterium]|nr:helix-turn-helix domain-containing protein [Micromonosporaceae bacterium]
MARESRRHITEPDVLDALAHPVRLDLIDYLMAAGPATASVCARAVRDTPSNCSYHLRVLARHGLVGEVASADGRERPWQALVTGFDTDVEPDAPASAAAARMLAVSVQRDQQLARDYLAHRDDVPAAWRAADAYATYTLRLSPAELTDLGLRIDALIRPYISATRQTAPDDAALVHVGVQAFATDTIRPGGDR